MSLDKDALTNAARALALLAEVRECGIDVTPYGSIDVFVGEGETVMRLSYDDPSGIYTLDVS